MFGVLEIIFCRNPIAGGTRIAGHLQIFLENLVGIATDPNFRAVTIIRLIALAHPPAVLPTPPPLWGLRWPRPRPRRILLPCFITMSLRRADRSDHVLGDSAANGIHVAATIAMRLHRAVFHKPLLTMSGGQCQGALPEN